MFTRRQPLLSAPEKPAAEDPPFKSKDHPVISVKTTAPSLYILISLVLFSIFLFFTSTTRQRPPPHHLPPPPEKSASACPAGILPFYVYPLPPKFNLALLHRCKSLNMYTDMCPFVSHTGLGQPLFLPNWYFTHQFLAEILFHHRALRHPCRVSDPSAARLFYAPFYAGLYASSVVAEHNLTLRDSLALDFTDHLTHQPWWRRHHGANHFFVSGRTAWDFLRAPGSLHDYGANRLLNLPAARNMTVLTVERQPWDRSLRQHGIPYPSYFHPLTSNELSTRQRRVLSLPRPHLFSFVGATRKGLEKAAVRNLIIRQCADSTKCKLLDCSGGRVGKCFDPMKVLRVLEGSNFCLQAPGDSFTRRSTFDSFLAGCVPVFFSEHTAYSQYAWYLPAEKGDYSVFIDEKSTDVKNIEQVLAAIPASRVRKMRENIVTKILPRVTYMHPDTDGGVFDAVDVALKALSHEIRSNVVDSLVDERLMMRD